VEAPSCNRGQHRKCSTEEARDYTDTPARMPCLRQATRNLPLGLPFGS
jgi:hypothetical protein